MKKRIVLIFALCLISVILCSCGKKTGDKEEVNNQDILNKLSSEQKKYLLDNFSYGDEALVRMSDEIVNYNLLGTGLEMYNKTKGVEVNGISYKTNKEFKIPESTGSKLITKEEAENIRLKEDNIRLEDFLAYKYEIVEDGENTYVFLLPLEGYDNCYIRFKTIVNNDEIHIKTPHIFHTKSETKSSGYTFSILYNKADFDEFVKNGYSDENIFYAFVQYGTVTNESLVVHIYNYFDKTKSFKSEYKIYKGDSDKGDVVDKGNILDDKKVDMEKNSYSVLPVRFSNKLEKGTYTINLGDGFLVETFEVE